MRFTFIGMWAEGQGILALHVNALNPELAARDAIEILLKDNEMAPDQAYKILVIEVIEGHAAFGLQNDGPIPGDEFVKPGGPKDWAPKMRPR